MGRRTPTIRGGINYEQTKIWNIYGKDVKENVIGVVLSVPLKHLVALYQKYKPKSMVHLADNVDPRRDTLHVEDTPN